MLAGEDVPDLIVSLEHGAALEGRVLTPAGQPVIGATVAVISGSAAGSLRWPNPTVTGEDGYYRLAGLGGGPLSVEAIHRDHQRVARDFRARPGNNRLDLTFEDGFFVAGWVVDDSGAPVAHARLSLGLGGPQATTEASGAFTFSNIRDGSYRIYIDRPGHALTVASDELVVSGAAVFDFEVRLEAIGSIAGRLYGLSFGELSRVTVSALSPGRSLVRGQVNHEGDYQVDGLEVGPWTVIAAIPGDPCEVTGSATLEPGVPEEILDLDFTAGLKLSGRVRRAGEPVVGAVVMATASDGMAGRSALTGTWGDFELAGLAAGSYQITIADVSAGLEHSQEMELDSDREIDVELDVP